MSSAQALEMGWDGMCPFSFGVRHFIRHSKSSTLAAELSRCQFNPKCLRPCAYVPNLSPIYPSTQSSTTSSNHLLLLHPLGNSRSLCVCRSARVDETNESQGLSPCIYVWRRFRGAMKLFSPCTERKSFLRVCIKVFCVGYWN